MGMRLAEQNVVGRDACGLRYSGAQIVLNDVAGTDRVQRQKQQLGNAVIVIELLDGQGANPRVLGAERTSVYTLFGGHAAGAIRELLADLR